MPVFLQVTFLSEKFHPIHDEDDLDGCKYTITSAFFV